MNITSLSYGAADTVTGGKPILRAYTDYELDAISGVVANQQVLHRCPVCNGCGDVLWNFYSRGTVASDAGFVECQSCKGKGYIVV